MQSRGNSSLGQSSTGGLQLTKYLPVTQSLRWSWSLLCSGRVRSNFRALQHWETTGAGIPRAGAQHGSSLPVLLCCFVANSYSNVANSSGAKYCSGSTYLKQQNYCYNGFQNLSANVSSSLPANNSLSSTEPGFCLHKINGLIFSQQWI